MKNFFPILFALLLSVCMSTSAQTFAPTPTSLGGQMLNLSNTIPSAVLDTATNATTVYLTMAKWNATTHLPAITPAQAGNGTISFGVAGTKISGTPAGTVTLEQSYNGAAGTWYPVHTWHNVILDSTGNKYPDVFAITNVASQAYSWDMTNAFARYYRLKITTTGTQVSSWTAFWYWNKI